MTPKVESTQLFKWLKRNDAELASRILMVRGELAKWLAEIAQLFPHYPSHALDHSDRIVAQLSKLLFIGHKPVVPFSTGEVYCLLCAAYLHDMGMVVSPGELANMLDSDTWKEFITEGGRGHDAFRDYLALRNGPVQGNRERTDFLANVALRQLLADFVRGRHHERGRTTLEMHPFLKQLVDHGDSVAFETIAYLGVGHGVSGDELADTSRFPEERDVLGDKVNLRFLARLLRIGDLLDMDSRRADPMTAQAVAPLPREAVPHWQQYSAKKHENITSKVIEFTFECKDQETHRILRDWFSWLESEVRAAGLEQLHAARHEKWRAPHCIVSSQSTPGDGGKQSGPTIIIKPARDAKYAFHDWKLELDHERILERLIYDVYDHPTVFIRELIQNALDATRCQMYVDFEALNPGAAMPERPTQFPAEFRERYPVLLSLTEEEVTLSPDAPTEKRWVFTIEDRGTGMNEQIITRYFLQVGRSYYQSNEFRERFKFAPTSRFGVGFLSVFAVSKNITVETAQRDEVTGKVNGLRLNLREPRNYLLTEPWTPFTDRSGGPQNGTRIRLVLDAWDKDQSLAELVSLWCVAVEVPVVIREAGEETVIRAERKVDKTVLVTSKVVPNGCFILRAFDLNAHGVEGQLAIIAYKDDKGEGWCDCWSEDKGLDGQREDVLPQCEGGFTSLHGIRMRSGEEYMSYRSTEEQWRRWADVRSAVPETTVERSMAKRCHVAFGRHHGSSAEEPGTYTSDTLAVHETTRRVVEEHLAESSRAKGKLGALYKGRVLSAAPVADAWRDQYPGTVVTWRGGQREDISVAQLLALEDFVWAAWPRFWHRKTTSTPPVPRYPKDVQSSLPIVSWSDTPSFSDDRFKNKVRGMNLCGVDRQDDLWLFTFSNTRTDCEFERAHGEGASWVAPLSLDRAGVRLDALTSRGQEFSVLNSGDPVVQWLYNLRAAAMSQPPEVDYDAVEACWCIAADRCWEFSNILAAWAGNPRVPETLKPPKDVRGNLAGLDLLDLGSRCTVIDD